MVHGHGPVGLDGVSGPTSRASPSTSYRPVSSSASCAANSRTSSARSAFDSRAANQCASSAVVKA